MRVASHSGLLRFARNDGSTHCCGGWWAGGKPCESLRIVDCFASLAMTAPLIVAGVDGRAASHASRFA
jgi:hypothetical protein